MKSLQAYLYAPLHTQPPNSLPQLNAPSVETTQESLTVKGRPFLSRGLAGGMNVSLLIFLLTFFSTEYELKWVITGIMTLSPLAISLLSVLQNPEMAIVMAENRDFSYMTEEQPPPLP